MASRLARPLTFALIAAALLAALIGLPTAAFAATTSTLAAGQQLGPGQALWSANGAYDAVMQTDGNFVVYGPRGPIWASNTGFGNGTVVVMQGDGNLVVYAPGGRAVWSSGTAPSNGDRLVMQSDGNLVVYAEGGLPLWASMGGRTSNGQDTLGTGSQLNPGQSITSIDGRFTAVMQTDGNFVEYGRSGATWASNTGTGNGTVVVMQGDGNLVVYAPGGRAVYSSGTAPSGGDRLVVQSDGNLVIYNGSGQAQWAKGQLLASGAALQNFQAWALNRANWNSTIPAGNPGIDNDGYFGAQCADLGIAWSKQAGHPVSFDGWDSSSSSKPGWHYVSGDFGAAQPGDVITRVSGRQHVVVVVGAPSGGVVSALQQNPGSPAVARYSTSTSGVIWRLN